MTRAGSSALVVGAGLALLAAAACGASSPAAPAAAAATATLTVRVLTYADQTTPIVGAVVTADDLAGFSGAWSTDASGAVVAAVPIGLELTVRASADGFNSFSAAGTLRDAETWTFWLDQGQEGAQAWTRSISRR